jgi:hypothetical protein
MISAEVLKEYPDIREYAFPKYFLDEGRLEGSILGIRKSISRQGTKKFGKPNPAQEAALLAIADEARLEALSEKLLDVDSWDALLSDNPV